MRKELVVLVGVVLLAGCAGSNEKLKAAEEENRRLTVEVEELREARSRLSGEVEHLSGLTVALEREKSSNTESLLALRRGAREFVLAQVTALNEFAGRDQLLDFLGGELVARGQVDGKDLALLDAGNPVPRGGRLLGVWGEFTGPASFRVVVVRPGEKGWAATAEAGPLAVEAAGPVRIRFESPLEVEPGDQIAYVFDGPVTVPFDRGTGGMRFADVKVQLGKKVDVEAFAGEEELRAYSIGVAGALDRVPVAAAAEVVGADAAAEEPAAEEPAAEGTGSDQTSAEEAPSEGEGANSGTATK